jgi:hypothetical protein
MAVSSTVLYPDAHVKDCSPSGAPRFMKEYHGTIYKFSRKCQRPPVGGSNLYIIAVARHVANNIPANRPYSCTCIYKMSYDRLREDRRAS